MIRVSRLIAISGACFILLTGCATTVSYTDGTAFCADPMVTTRHELFFGMLMPDSGYVSDLDFSSFIHEIVTPLFPGGFTLLDATGQFELASGIGIQEPTKVLVLIYHDNRVVREKIRDIIAEYRSRFRQESVGWVRSSARVCF